jgi:hypothetical protein
VDAVDGVKKLIGMQGVGRGSGKEESWRYKIGNVNEAIGTITIMESRNKGEQESG